MNRTCLRSTRLRAVAAPAGAALALAVALSACSAANENTTGMSGGSTDSSLSGTLNGAGSTAQQSAMAAWQSGFQSANPNVTVNYDGVGSGAGRDAFFAGGNTQFAGSDAALASDEIPKAKKRCSNTNPIELPVYVSPIAVIYNLKGVSGLQLDPKTLGGIMQGTITSWNDPAIRADNPGVTLPSTTITTVHRSDDSGTTFNFTEYLDATSGGAWTGGVTQTWPGKGGEAADGTSGVVASVKGGNGTIGYADASQAAGLGIAKIKVGSAYVSPSALGAAKVLDESSQQSGRTAGDLAIKVNRTTTTPGAYPLILISYHIVCQTYSDPSQAAMVKAFETYVVSSAAQDAAATTAGSAPITDKLRQRELAIINTIK